MGRLVCSKQEQKIGKPLSALILAASVVTVATSSVLLNNKQKEQKNPDGSYKNPDAKVDGGSAGGFIFGGSLFAYASGVAYILYSGAKII